MSNTILIPRKYQEEIFEQAQNENIIAALDTGSGKTLISVRLIQWMASRYTGERKKIYAFIVPRVPLVEQQTAFLSSQLPLTVRGYYGAIVDSWQHDPVKWAQEFRECDVMVMTAQIFLDAILHAHWSMTDVALLIFDEAHHARKNNPYNQILKEFYHTLSPHLRPKVFGMTASPIWNINNPLKSLHDLESNMLSKVVGVRENTDELLENSPRPNEIIVKYSTNASYISYSRSLWQQLADNGLNNNKTLVKDNIETRYFVTLYELGPFAADVYLASYIDTILPSHTGKHSQNYLMGPEYFFIPLVNGDSFSNKGLPASVEAMTAMRTLLNEFDAQGFRQDSFTVPNDWLSPKLRVLVNELCARRHNSFQGMVFVEQRQIATTLAWMLPRIADLKSWISPGAIVGHGAGRLGSTQGMVDKKQKQTIASFRNGMYNLLISTSVGEEGLDFQACDLVVRFNEVQHLVGYLQSRGRARRFKSTYLVMIPLEGSSKYEDLKGAEPDIRKLYQQRHISKRVLEEGEEEEEDPVDVAIREQFIIPSTGAVLTFGSAISLLNHLCALIPRDSFTKAIQPVYEGDFQVTVTLPSALPIPRDKLRFEGGIRNTKREAKAAAAFVACKALYDPLEVFDAFLLPVRKTSGYEVKDAYERLIPSVDHVDELLDILVYDPWVPWNIEDSQTTFTAWIHPFIFPGYEHAHMGLMTAGPLTTPLPEVPLDNGPLHFTTSKCVVLPHDMWQSLHDFTTLGIKWCNTSKAFDQLTCLLILLDPFGNPDLEQMRNVLDKPVIKDAGINHGDEGHLLLQTRHDRRPLLLHKLREDLTPLSQPLLEDSSDIRGRFSTYLEYFESIMSNRRYPISIPVEGPLLRVERFNRHFTSEYAHPSSKSKSMIIGDEQSPKRLIWIPAAMCEIFALSRLQVESFYVFPQIIRRITDVFRARKAVEELRLPFIDEDLVVEALTLPSTNISFSNQRLETLGDSVLKLCVVTHIFNRFPFRHEGQLDCLRQNSVSNRALIAWANVIGLGRFLSSEPSSVRKWRPTIKGGKVQDGNWYVERKFGRRGLQDCMESLLGASFLSGGLETSIQTGDTLKLCFGGNDSWNVRYPERPPDPVPLLYHALQNELGYQFKCGTLLCEAFTHPSAAANIPSYQRLEFLGDALLDLVVLEYLYHKFPEATSGQLTWAKSRAVWAPALTTIAIRRLSLQKYLMRNNHALEQAMNKAISEHGDMDYFHVVVEGWRYNPPKALSDVMESLCGAMFVDSHYDYERVKPVILKIMDPLLQVLRPKLPRDPTSELYIYMARKGCQNARFEKFNSLGVENKLNDSIRFKVHGIVIGEPFHGGSRGLDKAKPLLAFNILKVLETESSVEGICDCHLTKDKLHVTDLSVDRNELDDETEEGFAILAAIELQDVAELPDSQVHIDRDGDEGENEDEDEEAQVEALLDVMEL
ncbi:hypothetical protein Clacol_006450 [Clathrus columnatus]|uniref:Dicer-like protein 1 n=1 Tax=Clathrus columnatus TaxID=1419009 RepID=A0AAV5AC44_9AGAM|nr:hypothetical protein Clacol_006450 [Clathrus columnatus]